MSQPTQETELYQEVVMRHHRNPYGEGMSGSASCEARANNPLCGDEVTIRLAIRDGRVAEARFTAQACAVCRASASLLCRMIEGMEETAAAAWVARFQDAIRDSEILDESTWGEAAALHAVRAFPARRRCVLLPWEAAQAALAASGGGLRVVG